MLELVDSVGKKKKGGGKDKLELTIESRCSCGVYLRLFFAILVIALPRYLVTVVSLVWNKQYTFFSYFSSEIQFIFDSLHIVPFLHSAHAFRKKKKGGIKSCTNSAIPTSCQENWTKSRSFRRYCDTSPYIKWTQIKNELYGSKTGCKCFNLTT